MLALKTFRFAGRRLTALRSDRNGLSAIEFAFVAMPFFTLLIGLVEICVMFVISTVLEQGAREAARDIRTGAFQRSGAATLEQFEANICAAMADLFDCENAVAVDVRTFTDFPSSAVTTPYRDDGTLDTSQFSFDPGGRENIVVVRVYYQWNLITPIISRPMANMPNNQRLMLSTVAFRNEPF